MRVSIDNGELELFKKLMDKGYAVEDRANTRRMIRELRRANVSIHRGYDVKTEKMVLAVESVFKVVPRRRTLNKTIFDLK